MPQIPTFSLFGESGELADVVHCETIAARSALHGWELGSHRHGRLHQVILLVRGGGLAALDDRAEALRARSAVNVPLGCVHSFRFDPETRGWVVTLASELLDEALAHAGGAHRTLAQAAVCRADTQTLALASQIAAEHDRRAYAGAQVLRGLAIALLGLIARQIVAQGLAAGKDGAGNRLLGRFEVLIEEHFGEHWRVADYARELAITPTHLSRLAREATGKPASALIDERLIREARRLLVYTGQPISSVAYALGFNDPAYFTRVFARATGVSPSAFRGRLEANATGRTQREGHCD